MNLDQISSLGLGEVLLLEVGKEVDEGVHGHDPGLGGVDPGGVLEDGGRGHRVVDLLLLVPVLEVRQVHRAVSREGAYNNASDKENWRELQRSKINRITSPLTQEGLLFCQLFVFVNGVRRGRGPTGVGIVEGFRGRRDLVLLLLFLFLFGLRGRRSRIADRVIGEKRSDVLS